MSKKLTVLAVAGLFLTVTATGSFAEPGTNDPGVNARQSNQQQRIQEGVKSGELTKEERRKLRKEQRELRRQERAAKRDGTLTGQERRDLHKKQNQMSKDIYQEKHDADKR